MAAGLEIFGPDHEVAVEIVPFAGESSLMDALTYENSIHRNQLVHCHEMVAARRQWWDEKVFNDYPSWEESVEDRLGYFGDRTLKNKDPVPNKLQTWFGKAPESGPGNYAKSCNYGIGATVLATMLNLHDSEVAEALRALPLSGSDRDDKLVNSITEIYSLSLYQGKDVAQLTPKSSI